MRSIHPHLRVANRSLHSEARRGFTLLELLLALGLTVFLLGILFSALDLHWRFSLTGQAEVERAQIARAIFQRMTGDIRSVVFRPESSTTSSSDSDDSSTMDDSGNTDDSNSGGDSSQSDSSGDSSSQTNADDVADPSAGYSGNSLGVFGDGQTLVLHVRRPIRESRDLAVLAATPFARSDLKAVAYYLSGSMSGLMLGGTAPLGADSSAQGLTRMSADRLSLGMTDASFDQVSAASQTELLAPEIDYLAFEYHDGFEWLPTWDSEREGRLPNAIGIAIGFRQSTATTATYGRPEVSELTDRYRIVVMLPAANSFEGLSF